MTPKSVIPGAAASEQTHQTPRWDARGPFVSLELSRFFGFHDTVGNLFYKCAKVTGTQAILDTSEEG